ncbi:peroxiredoxin [Phycicoccus flavus]|uniref:peroxiredoxin n=1 Tax=Phycicoccus flavus TaxID=2502783 RepID=UPI000FEBDCE2|nr:peroxiredoxin [Phycicoccus flavus]NHA69511.1 peroxiredoxin [Phycicoccus flavus]
MTDLGSLPADLPVPQDDGRAAHLPGSAVPDVTLPATDGTDVHLPDLAGLVVLSAYPMTGTPGVALPEGWDAIPGARGCTPESCGFRDHHADLRAAGADHVLGVSTQTGAEQRELAQRLGLPYPVLSDAGLDLARAWRLPTFAAGGRTLLARLTLLVRDGVVERVLYPVFPPDRHAAQVLGVLRSVA